MPVEAQRSVLHPADLVGFLVTTDVARAKGFFCGKLGFRTTSEDPFGVMLEADGRPIRLQKAERFDARPGTVLGWNVADAAATVERLAAAGVACERFAGMPQDELGIMTFPDGARVAWFKDPDGNVLSVAQLPR